MVAVRFARVFTYRVCSVNRSLQMVTSSSLLITHDSRKLRQKYCPRQIINDFAVKDRFCASLILKSLQLLLIEFHWMQEADESVNDVDDFRDVFIFVISRSLRFYSFLCLN